MPQLKQNCFLIVRILLQKSLSVIKQQITEKEQKSVLLWDLKGFGCRYFRVSLLSAT